MAEIKEIRISGFRGIKACLPLNFEKSNSVRSMIIYGRNGTGKSSITDAWEWLQTEKIEHLRREGAGVSSYPHKFSEDGDTYIEIDFVKEKLGTVKLEYDFSRVTMPKASGNIEEFRDLVPHPCFIRFEDLTRFVYLTKTEKFDALARLMGFMPQVELQKSFRRVLRNFGDFIDDEKRELSGLVKRLKATIDIEDISKEEFLLKMNEILKQNEIDIAPAIIDLPVGGDKLNEMVVNDPKAKALSNLKSISSVVNKNETETDCLRLARKLISDIQKFLDAEQEFSKLLLLELYEHGEKVVSQVDEDGIRVFSAKSETGELLDLCPLCGQVCDDDLLSHITKELKNLRKLKESRDNLDEERKELLENLPPKGTYQLSFEQLGDDKQTYQEKFPLENIKIFGEEVEGLIQKLDKQFGVRVDRFSDALVGEIETTLTEAEEKLTIFIKAKNDLNIVLEKEISELEKGSDNREKLVSDNSKFELAIKLWEEIQQTRENISNYERTFSGTEEIVEDYIQSSISNVKKRFETISDDVRDFFEILEKDTEGLKGASLRLLTDEDRAVELQVDFHGDQIYPAYKYLSESQLNSFGLSVFLASAKFFNSDFNFIILDDIINSFDGYKRPRICELLKQKFSDHQILLLTHDKVWKQRLSKAFQSSVKKKFIRWELNHGPIYVDGLTPLEKIQKLIDNDDPVAAGSLMGLFLERQFQELGEKFEVMVKYNRLNQYTLAPLADRFRVRAQKKLGKDHDFVKAIQDLNDEIGFRNLCAHWKNPAIQLTMEEMNSIVEKWKKIEKMARCQEPKCLEWLEYDRSISGFVCPCGKTKLVK